MQQAQQARKARRSVFGEQNGRAFSPRGGAEASPSVEAINIPSNVQKLDFSAQLHDEGSTGILSIFNSMHSLQCVEPEDRQAEQFKQAIIQWSMTYAVAYALLLTVSFALLIESPVPEVTSKDMPGSSLFVPPSCHQPACDASPDLAPN